LNGSRALEDMILQRKAGTIVLWCALSALWASCGYQLVTQESVSLPGGIESICVPLAKNRTMEPALEDVFTQRLIRIIRSDGRVRVLRPGRAEAELVCVLDDLSTRTVSYDEQGRAAAEEVSFSARCALWDPGGERTLIELPKLSASEDYPVGDDYLASEEARSTALVEVSKELAESVRSVLLDGF